MWIKVKLTVIQVTSSGICRYIKMTFYEAMSYNIFSVGKTHVNLFMHWQFCIPHLKFLKFPTGKIRQSICISLPA